MSECPREVELCLWIAPVHRVLAFLSILLGRKLSAHISCFPKRCWMVASMGGMSLFKELSNGISSCGGVIRPISIGTSKIGSYWQVGTALVCESCHHETQERYPKILRVYFLLGSKKKVCMCGFVSLNPLQNHHTTKLSSATIGYVEPTGVHIQ